jgi:hypothetical protein
VFECRTLGHAELARNLSLAKDQGFRATLFAMNTKKQNARLIAWSLIWALGLLACGIWFKGDPAKDQIVAAVTVFGTLVLLALLPRRSNCAR